MKILLTFIAVLFVGCGKSDNVDGDTWIHGYTNNGKVGISIQLKKVGGFKWVPESEFNKTEHYRVQFGKDRKLIGTVASKEEVAKIRKYIGKD